MIHFDFVSRRSNKNQQQASHQPATSQTRRKAKQKYEAETGNFTNY
jgi:hypothetical protein